jgi:hypothetical protein
LTMRLSGQSDNACLNRTLAQRYDHEVIREQACSMSPGCASFAIADNTSSRPQLSCRTQAVFRKLGGHEGALRLQNYGHMAGEERTSTTATEAGAKLHLDIAKVYYSPRSAPERLRIAGLVQRCVCMPTECLHTRLYGFAC